MAFTSSNSRAAAWRPGAFCLAGLLGLVCLAHAGGNTPADSGLIDLDGDKRISYEEFVHSAAVQAMREMDTDKNGAISRGEVQASGPRPANGPVPLVFSKIDSNGDGQVDLDELKKPLADSPEMRKAFQDLDKDNDGYLSGPELNGFDNGTHVRVVPQISIEF
jgi:Ca2+-binding EF-hand superfamily protein